MTPPASPAPSTTAQERQQQGIRALAALLNYWLPRSGGWTHAAMEAIGNWAYGEPTPMQHSVISRCRNANQPRGAGLAHLDALAELNQAIWLYQERGAGKAIKAYGPFSSWGIEQQWLDDAVWLQKPDRPSEPLDLGDFAMLLAGRLELPYVGPHHVGKTEAVRLCAGVAPLLDEIASKRGWGPGQAVRHFLQEYPSSDTRRQKRIRQLLSGEKPLATAELEQELPALAEMIRRVEGLSSYGPSDLQCELLSDSRPNPG